MPKIYQPQVICEIGLNHFGDESYADKYIDGLLKSAPDGITFLARETDFYKGKFKNWFLPDKYYRKAAKRIKSAGVKFGMSICDIEKINFFEEIKADFYKIVGKDINNFELVRAMLKTNKSVFISTGIADDKQIRKFINLSKNYTSKITLIQTQLNYETDQVNLKAISLMKKKFGLPVAFGLHAVNPNVLYTALGFEPSAVFLYIKGNRRVAHGDEEHAISLKDYPVILSNLRELPRTIGTGQKVKMKSIFK